MVVSNDIKEPEPVGKKISLGTDPETEKTLTGQNGLIGTEYALDSSKYSFYYG